MISYYDICTLGKVEITSTNRKVGDIWVFCMISQVLMCKRLVDLSQSKEYPNYFGLHFTNFACGADSFIEHFYKHIMGQKPYLILELDEHSAVAGAMTRLEAYKNVIENTMQKMNAELKSGVKLAN